MSLWERRTLGRTGLNVSRIGLGSSYGIGARDVERAFERGINYMYWGSARRPGFGRGIRNIARRNRQDLVVVVQTYSRARIGLRPSVELALRRLRIDYADVLLLGWWNAPPPDRIIDGALALREAGKVRHLMVSCHDRPTFVKYIQDPCYGAIMVRYNAAHTGAEREVFPYLDEAQAAPGVVAYTATRWGALMDPKMTPHDEQLPTATDCYRFVLSNPHVDLTLSGPANARQLDDALAALERGVMDEDELAWMRRVGKHVHSLPARSVALQSPFHLWERVMSRNARS